MCYEIDNEIEACYAYDTNSMEFRVSLYIE